MYTYFNIIANAYVCVFSFTCGNYQEEEIEILFNKYCIEFNIGQK